MGKNPEFIPHRDGRVCQDCGSLLGRFGEMENVRPCPACNQGVLLPGVDPSYLYRARVLLFVPDPEPEDAAGQRPDGCEQVGKIIAVRSEEVTSDIARQHAPVVATGVCWPRDRKHFGELFDHHIHHVHGPLVEPPNDGWDANRPLPVL